MASVILKHINKVYPNKVQAVFDFYFEIKDFNELFNNIKIMLNFLGEYLRNILVGGQNE